MATELSKEKRIKLGKDFENTRTALGWSIEQVATMADVKPITIKKIEDGAFNVPLDILTRVADVLSSDLTIRERSAE